MCGSRPHKKRDFSKISMAGSLSLRQVPRFFIPAESWIVFVPKIVETGLCSSQIPHKSPSAAKLFLLLLEITGILPGPAKPSSKRYSRISSAFLGGFSRPGTTRGRQNSGFGVAPEFLHPEERPRLISVEENRGDLEQGRPSRGFFAIPVFF